MTIEQVDQLLRDVMPRLTDAEIDELLREQPVDSQPHEDWAPAELLEWQRDAMDHVDN
jgi:hypothetical protein